MRTDSNQFEMVRVVGDGGSNPLSDGTRTYNFAAATRTAVGAASVATALGTLNSTREVMITSDTDCFVRFGDNAVVVAATDAPALPISAGLPFHLRVPADATHFAVIQSSAAGFIRVTPVA